MIFLITAAIVVIVITSLGYSSAASTNLPDGDDLKSAKTRLIWISTVGWLTVIAILIVTVYLMVEGSGYVESEVVMYVVLFIILALLSFSSWLNITATKLISNSTEYKTSTSRTSKINVAYQDAYMASALSLGTILALVLSLLSYYSGRWSVDMFYNGGYGGGGYGRGYGGGGYGGGESEGMLEGEGGGEGIEALGEEGALLA